MPDFVSISSIKKSERKLSKEDLIRGIRFSIAAEYEAVQLYTELAEATDDQYAISVLLDITKEELVHAGQFLKLLKRLAPDEEQHYEEGANEDEEIWSKLKKKK